MKGVHVGRSSQEPLIQNDQEDEVDAGQEAQPHVRQREGQVEALWVHVGEWGGLGGWGGWEVGPPGTRGTQEAIPSYGPGPSFFCSFFFAF